MTTSNTLIGIDPGIVSGFAIYETNQKALTEVTSVKLFKLFELLKWQHYNEEVAVYIEDPHTWKPFGKMVHNASVLQGAGAVKQTFNHIVELMDHLKIPYFKTKLQGSMKKTKADYFNKITGWEGKTNEHGRDAAMLVFGRKPIDANTGDLKHSGHSVISDHSKEKLVKH